MRGLRDALEQSEKDGVAIGHFNVADWVLLKAVLASGQELKVPVVVGASEGEREFFGVRQIAALVRSLREECDCRIFLNADHTHSLAKAVEAARVGFDAIVFDLSALPFTSLTVSSPCCKHRALHRRCNAGAFPQTVTPSLTRRRCRPTPSPRMSPRFRLTRLAFCRGASMFAAMLRSLPAGFIAPCLPTKADTLPSGEMWLHG
jgi:Fructose-bisphosphate aldolase class-II